MPKTKINSAPKQSKPRITKRKPTLDEIALRAYHLFLERSGAPGNPLEDWLRAESELRTAPAKPRGKTKVISIAA